MAKLRLGGMALSNGVLVHGPTAWACAIRLPDGRSRSPRRRRAGLPQGSSSRCCADRPGSPRPSRCCRRCDARLPEARFAVRAPRRARRGARERRSSRRACADSRRLGGLAGELVAGARLASCRPCSRCAAASSPPTTAPSTSRSAPTSSGERATKEHERCGAHLVGPLLATLGRRQRSCRGCPGAPAAAGAARRHGRRGRRSGRGLRLDEPAPGAPARSRACAPGPRAPAPLRHGRAVAGAARGRRGGARRLPASSSRDVALDRREARLPPGDLRPPGREDARGLLHGRVLQPHARGAARRRPPPARRDAGLPEEARRARRHGRGDRDPQALRGRVGDADGARAPRRRPHRAVGDGADDRGRLHALRAPRDGLPRHARAADADHDERRRACSRRRTASRSSSCPLVTTTTACRRATATPPTSPGADRGARRRHLRRAGVLVGRSRHRHRPACADRGVRRQHRARGDEVRRVGAGRTSTSSCSSTSRTTRCAPRSRSRARSARGSGACGSTRPASSSIARCGTSWATSTRAASTSGSSGRCARRSTRTASSASGSSPPAASPSRRSRRSRRRAFPWTPTASARRSSAARTTSPRTSC